MSHYTVLGLAGPIGSGKTTLADELVKEGWVRVSFADGVREMALRLDPVIPAFDGDAYWSLSRFVGLVGWDDAKQEPEVRRILQVVGTEMVRSISPDHWVNTLCQRIYKMPAGTKIVVDDVRFPNECDRIRYGLGGKVLLLDGGHPAGSGHESESHFANLNVSEELPWMPLVQRVAWVKAYLDQAVMA